MWFLAVAVLALFSAIVFFYWSLGRNPVHRGLRGGLIRPPVHQILAERENLSYGLKEYTAPRVTGVLFRILVWLSFTRLGYVILVRRNMRKSNLHIFKGEYIPDEPTHRPCIHYSITDASKTTPVCVGDEFFLGLHKAQIMNEFQPLSIVELHLAYKSGKLTPVDVARSVLNAVSDSNERNPPLRAIVECYAPVVMEMAESSSQRWARGEPLSLLDGVPVAIKGEMYLDPYPFLCGGKIKIAAMEGVSEGPNISTLRGSGAVIIGVCNMQELGKGTLGSNPHSGYQTARNPHNINHFCGGSSSGAAASVSAGLCPLAMGGDGGGSIRIPASLCGVVGLKPTYGLLSSVGGTPMGFTVGVPGPIGATVLDTAIALSLLDKEKRVSLSSLNLIDLSDLKIGVYWDYFNHCNKEVRESCRKGLNAFETLGAQIKDIVIPELEEAKVAHMFIILTEGSSSLSNEIDKHFWDFNPETLTPILVGLHTSGTDYVNAMKQRTRSIAFLKQLFEDVDIIVMPATACTAPTIPSKSLSHGISDVKTSGDLMRFSFLANLTGIPGLVLPIQKEGLPVGLQLLGPWYSEGLLLRAGLALESAGVSGTNRPQVYYDLLK